MTDWKYSVLIFILKSIMFFSVMGTLVIPVFFSDKIMKPQEHNYIAPYSLSEWKQITRVLGRLSFTGYIFILCVIVSVILGGVTTFLDNKTAEAAANKNFENIEKLNKAHFKETERINKENLANQLRIEGEKNELKLKFKDSLSKKESEIQELNRIKQVNRVQSTVDTVKLQLTEKNFQYENLSQKLQQEHRENVELQKVLNSPIIEAFEGDSTINNPHLKKDTINNRLIFELWYTNSGKGSAKNLRSTSYRIDVYNNRLYSEKLGIGIYDDKTFVLTEGKQQSYMIRLPINEYKTSFFVAYELKYQNSFGEEQPPFRNIYLFDSSFINKSIPKITRIDKEQIEAFLISSKIWIK